MSEVPDERPVQVTATFEGQAVSEMEGRLPAIIMEMEEGYPRGTILRLNLEVRVRDVNFHEDRKGDLVRKHTFVLEEVQLVTAFNPVDRRDDVGGSASAYPSQTPEEAEELGVQIGRTSEIWDKPPQQDSYGETGVYFCPTAGEVEMNPGGGFDICCDKPELHRPPMPGDDSAVGF